MEYKSLLNDKVLQEKHAAQQEQSHLIVSSNCSTVVSG